MIPTVPASRGQASERLASTLAPPALETAGRELDDAVSGLRCASRSDHLPQGLLTRAWLRSLTGARTGPASAQSDLDEAWEIAARGPMPLFMADIHLYRARLLGEELQGEGVEELKRARALIEKHGYLRRLPELEDAEKALRL